MGAIIIEYDVYKYMVIKVHTCNYMYTSSSRGFKMFVLHVHLQLNLSTQIFLIRPKKICVSADSLEKNMVGRQNFIFLYFAWVIQDKYLTLIVLVLK